MAEPDAVAVDCLVRAGHVVTAGPAGVIADGAVAIGGDRIVAVEPFAALAARYPQATVVGDDAGLLTPGLINAHTHFSEGLIPGMADGWTTWEWGEKLVARSGGHLTRRMAEAGTLLRGAELLLSGVTCVSDMFCHTHPRDYASLGVVDGLAALGLRGIVSFGAEDTFDGGTAPPAYLLGEHEALAAAAAAVPNVDFRLGVGTLLGQSDRLLRASVAAARSNGWAVHTHLAEVREEKIMARLRWGRSAVEHAAAEGLLAFPTLVAHAIWLDDSERALLADHGASVVHNPVCNMLLGSGVCDVPALRAAGIAVALGTDGAASNDSHDMLEVVKTAALLQKVHRLNPAAIGPADVIAMATAEGARALGLEGETGALIPGLAADLVRFDGGGAGPAIVHDAARQLVYGCGARDVTDVWVAGQRRVAGGRLASVDLADIIALARPLAAKLATAADLGALSCLASSS